VIVTPGFSPVGKVKQTIWEMLDKKGKVSPEFMKQADAGSPDRV
jgi:hypothetical protein